MVHLALISPTSTKIDGKTGTYLSLLIPVVDVTTAGTDLTLLVLAIDGTTGTDLSVMIVHGT